MLYFSGLKSAERRQAVESGVDVMTLQVTALEPDNSRAMPIGFKPYRKTTLTYAVQLAEPFTVDTLEGEHTGKAGDWLAVGAHGEMYPIDAAVFAETYEAVE